MIKKEIIEDIINEKIKDTDLFLVEITVSKSNQINIYVDSMDGIDITTCIDLSRYVEDKLNRDQEDFELNVSSGGIDRPLKVLKQYIKNIGQELKIDTQNGERLKGILKNADETAVTLEWEEKVKVEGKKKKQLVTNSKTIEFKDIKEAKIIIGFK